MIQAGQLITDGTAVFIVDDIRDGNRVGDIVLRHTLREGYIKANGAVVTASDYPRLVQYVIDNNLTISEEDWQAGQYDKYVYNSDADTLRVPNLIDRFLEGSDTNATVNAGLPNIEGELQQITASRGKNYTDSFFSMQPTSDYFSGGNSGINNSVGYYTPNVDASRSNAIYGNSNTVQPAAIKLIAQIKY